jgi:hypothetical protein
LKPFIGDEERELARYGGAAERAALTRRTGLSGKFIGTTTGPSFEQDRDMDIVERMILRAGTANGWPVWTKKQDFDDYKLRAVSGDASATRTLAIINRYMKAGKLKIDSGKRDDKLTYAMGKSKLAGEFVPDSDLRDDEDESSPGDHPESSASSAKQGLKSGRSGLKTTSQTISQAQTARSQAKDVAAATAWAAKLMRKGR